MTETASNHHIVQGPSREADCCAACAADRWPALQALVEASPAAMFALGRDDRAILWNEAAERMFGWSRVEMIGRRPWDEFGAASDLFRELQTAVRLGQNPSPAPVRLQRRDGIRLDVKLTALPVPVPNGIPAESGWASAWIAEPTACAWTGDADVRDFTRGVGCILWEEVLSRRDGRYYWDFHIIDENAAARVLPLDVPPGTAYVQVWLSSRLPEDRAVNDEAWHRAIHGDLPGYIQEFRCRRKDGEIRWFSEVVRIERTGADQWRLFGVCVDVTELRQAQEDLRYVIRRAGCLLWHASVAVDDQEPSGFRWESQVFDEEAAQRFFPTAMQPGETYTDGWFRARQAEENAGGEDAAAAALTSGAAGYSREFRCRCLDGESRWLLEQVHIERVGDGRWRLVGVCTDITALKTAEEQIHSLNAELERRVLERTTLLEAANQELESFAYSVAHDLRGPLRSIDGFTCAVIEEYGQFLAGDGAVYLDRVRCASQHMGEVMDDLLSLSRITRGEMNYEPVDLGELARSIVRGLHESEPERTVEFEAGPGLVVTGAPHLLRIALENLIGNAWKFTRGRPSARVQLGAEEQEDGRVYFLRDNGAGFSMEYAHKLFQPFQRLHSPGEFEGTGIGLAIVHRAIRRHGGRVWAAGRPGKGATFYFQLPPSPLAIAAPPPAPPPTGPSPTPPAPIAALPTSDRADSDSQPAAT